MEEEINIIKFRDDINNDINMYLESLKNGTIIDPNIRRIITSIMSTYNRRKLIDEEYNSDDSILSDDYDYDNWYNNYSVKFDDENSTDPIIYGSTDIITNNNHTLEILDHKGNYDSENEIVDTEPMIGNEPIIKDEPIIRNKSSDILFDEYHLEKQDDAHFYDDI